MKKTIKAFITLILILSIILPGVVIYPAYSASYNDEIDEILKNQYLLNNVNDTQSLINKYAENISTSPDWLVYSIILQNKSLDYSIYSNSLLKHAQSSYTNDAEKMKYALIFTLLGTNKNYIDSTLKNIGSNSMYMSLVFCLHLLNNGNSASISTNKLIDVIIDKQLADGGWALSGQYGDVDVTAMTIQALAPHYSYKNSVKQSVDKALSFLKERQMENGSFKSYGKENSESCAQVIIALCALGKNPENYFNKSVLNAMLSYKVESGQFAHSNNAEEYKYNLMATSQVFLALTAITKNRNVFLFNTFKPVYDETTANYSYSSTTSKSTTTKIHRIEQKNKENSSKNIATTNNINISTNKEIAANTTAILSDASNVTVTSQLSTPSTTTNITPTSKNDVYSTITETQNIINGNDKISNDTTESNTSNSINTGTNSSTKLDIKQYLIITIWSIALGVIIILIAKGNKKPTNYIIIIVAAILCSTLIHFANIQTKEQFYNDVTELSGSTITATISIRCDTVAGRGDESLTPSNGIILDTTVVTLNEGATVYDCLIYVAKTNMLIIEDKTQTLDDHSSAYIIGINNLREFTFGELSGWVYSVNGDRASVGCGEYKLKDGDIIKWEYTCNLGDDLK